MASGEQMLALGQQLGQVLFENNDLRERVERLEEMLMARGISTLAPAEAAGEEPAPIPADPMADFMGLGNQATQFVNNLNDATKKASSPPTPPPHP